MNDCPIEGHGLSCACAVDRVTEAELGLPFGVVLARCPNGHHEVVGPRTIGGLGWHGYCVRCRLHLEQVGSAILTPIP